MHCRTIHRIEALHGIACFGDVELKLTQHTDGEMVSVSKSELSRVAAFVDF